MNQDMKKQDTEKISNRHAKKLQKIADKKWLKEQQRNPTPIYSLSATYSDQDQDYIDDYLL